MGNEAKKRYLSAVKKNLRCSEKQKKSFLAELEASLNAFLSETPDATEARLGEMFGAPEKVAEDFLTTLDAKDIKKAFGWKKIVLIGVIIALLIWGAGVTIALIDSHVDAHGYGVESIGNDNTGYKIVTMEEFS
ncbi:MAG: hypothetical protein IJU56_02870 [Clostridia bacterium]|nr:hypothetical protein [Clostridia bacterium]